MEKNDFARLENMCQYRFMEAGACFHVCSKEDFPVLFHSAEDFKKGMNAVAYAAFLCPGVKVLTFELMSNHFHFTLSGNNRAEIEMFVSCFEMKLKSLVFLSVSMDPLCALQFKIIPIDTLENLRNVIAYTNRNGAVVHPEENVFSYEWGANRFFFNREAVLRYASSGCKATFRQKREIFHSDKLTGNEDIILMDGYVSPMCYCRIDEAEGFFRNSRHYFYSVARNVEVSRDIAKVIGESLFYTDEDLFLYIKSICSRKYDCSSASALPPEAKINIAKELHFSFNAGAKQISRLLKMDLNVIKSLFGDR